MSVPETLRKAADHIEAVGFNQDGNYYQGGYIQDDTNETRPCCTIGAFKVVSESEASARAAIRALADDLGFTGFYPHDHVVMWNDRESTTEADVLARLRATADRVETEETSA